MSPACGPQGVSDNLPRHTARKHNKQMIWLNIIQAQLLDVGISWSSVELT